MPRSKVSSTISSSGTSDYISLGRNGLEFHHRIPVEFGLALLSVRRYRSSFKRHRDIYVCLLTARVCRALVKAIGKSKVEERSV